MFNRENKKCLFMFKYSGPVFNEYIKRELDIKQMEAFVDSSDSYVNVAIYTFDRHRPSELKNMISRYNNDMHATPHLKIQIRQQSEFDDVIITLSNGRRNPKNHSFYLRIQNAKEQGDSSYLCWTSALLRDRASKDGVNNEESLEEFDVVKKRRLMAYGNPNPDDSTSELERFEEFEQAVLPALLEIHGDDQNNRAMELIQLEKELQSGTVTTNGGVYIACCAAFGNYLKIGATRRSEPTQRLYEISRYVPVPFRLIAWIPSGFPFQLEADLHRRFDAQRLKSNGAGTEFFKLEIPVLMELLPELV
jgi:hypothetical protein